MDVYIILYMTQSRKFSFMSQHLWGLRWKEITRRNSKLSFVYGASLRQIVVQATNPNGNDYNKDRSECSEKVAPGGKGAHRTQLRGESSRLDSQQYVESVHLRLEIDAQRLQ